MRRTLVILTVLAIALFTVPTNSAFGETTSLKFYPLNKDVPMLLSSYAETNVDITLALGKDATNARRAQGFKVPVTRTVGRVSLWLRTIGVPPNNLTVDIETDSGGLPSGTMVAGALSNPVAGSSIGPSDGWVAFDFPTPPQLTASTQYHLVLKSSGTDTINYYFLGTDQSSPSYSDGAASVYNTGAWQATAPAADYVFQVRPAFTVEPYVKDIATISDCPPPSGTQPCGLGAYTLKITFDPAMLRYVSIQNTTFLGSTGRNVQMCFNSAGHDPLNGTLTYTCLTSGVPAGQPTPLGPTGSGPLATITFVPLALGTSSVQFLTDYTDTILTDVPGRSISYTAQAGSVTAGSYGTTDSDGDGCADIEETGDDPNLGGDRNPSDAYDFYDVPVPANPDPTPSGPRNKAVSMSDVLAVLVYVGTHTGDAGHPNPKGVTYDSLKDGDWNGDTVVNSGDKVGRRYDRTASWPFSGAPDNAVAMGDVLAALAQSGANCVAPP